MGSFIDFIWYLFKKAKEEHEDWKETDAALDEIIRTTHENEKRWNQERPKLEAEAARNALAIFARNMMKLKQKRIKNTI